VDEDSVPAYSRTVLTRRQLLGTAVAGGLALALPERVPAAPSAALPGAGPGDSIVLRWNAALLQGVRESRLGPPMIARALAVAHTSIYDAWAAYDRNAAGTRLGGNLRRPPADRTLANKNAAISFAAYRAAVELFPMSRGTVFDPLMQELGYSPADISTSLDSPAGVGNVAAAAVLEFRRSDGANQRGDEAGGLPGVPYSDYTGFLPSNDPMDPLAPFDPSAVHDPNAWQPLSYHDASGAYVTPAFVGAQWNRVVPFALSDAAQLRSSAGPARYGGDAYREQAQALLDLSSMLTDEQKVIAEYWADGPHSELPPGHWDLHAQFVSRRDRHGANEHGTDLDVKLFFALTNAIHDAAICCWDNKRTYASVRPITAIRVLFLGQPVRAWAGPYRGTRTIDGGSWLPYQPATFPTPPFPEFSSGHSTFSAAGAEILRLFTGKDDFGASAFIPAKSSRVEPGAVPADDVTLHWATFTEAANQAGISRRFGGIHFEQGDLDGRSAGRLVARQAWQKALAYFGGGDAG
jgi:Domain of unknown function (DUF6851)/VCPO second helical-bundle domain